MLISNAPNTVSIDQLIENVWQGIEVSSETVTQRIALLRKALNVELKHKIQYISSIRNKGYRWVPEVKEFNQEKKFNSIKFLASLLVSVFVIFLIVIYATRQPANQNYSEINKNKDEYLSQARIYLQKHDLPSNKIALKLFRKSLTENPENPDAMIGIAFAICHQVTKYNQSIDLLDEAEELANKAVELSPDNSNAWIALGFIKDARGEIDQAIKLYKKGIELNPKDHSSKSSLAYLYSQKGRLVEAMELNISAVGSKQPYLNLQIANTLELLGFNSIAEKWYQKADELSPDNVFVTHQMARFYISNDQNSKAIEIIGSAMDRGIQRPELHVLLGIIALMDKNYEKANINFNNALKVDSNDFEASLWRFIVNSDSEVSKTKFNEFENKWFVETGNWPDVEIFKALFMIHNNRFEEAIQSLENSYKYGYLNHQWIKKLPPFYSIKENSKFIKVIELMQNNTSNQRQQLINADWLPASFLDPQKY